MEVGGKRWVLGYDKQREKEEKAIVLWERFFLDHRNPKMCRGSRQAENPDTSWLLVFQKKKESKEKPLDNRFKQAHFKKYALKKIKKKKACIKHLVCTKSERKAGIQTRILFRNLWLRGSKEKNQRRTPIPSPEH